MPDLDEVRARAEAASDWAWSDTMPDDVREFHEDDVPALLDRLEPTEAATEAIGHHRAVRPPDSPTALVLRAAAWAAVAYVGADIFFRLLDVFAGTHRHVATDSVLAAALAVLQVVYSHRRRQR